MMQFPCQKNFLEKTDQNWRKDLQLTPTQMLKNKQLKMVFRTNRRSLKYVPKKFLKVNACARDPPWCYKNTQFSRQHTSVTHANQEGYILSVSSAVPCFFDLQTTVSCYNFKLDKDFYPRWSLDWHLQSWLDTQIAVYPSTFQLPTKK